MQVNEIFCHGSNKFGQAGLGKKYHNQTFSSFTRMVFPVFIKQVVCGSHHSGLLTLQGMVYMMGSNINGVLGSPTNSINYSYNPILVPNLSDVNKISSGHFHMCAISQGRLYSWGKGIDGQLGTGKQSNCALPALVQSFGQDVEDVSCGLNHTLVRTAEQKCYAFGNGIYGQLGVGSNKNSAYPLQVRIEGVVEIAAGENFSLFLKEDGLYGTGDNSSGQISTQIKKKYTLQPTLINIQQATAIRAGKLAAAVIQDKKICVWGFRPGSEPIILGDTQDYIMDVQIGGNLVYCLTSQGQLYEWKYEENNTSGIMKQTDLKNKTVLGFSVGETHSLVLGDIVDQIICSEKVLKTLQNIDDPDFKQNGKIISRKSSIVKLENFQQSHQSEAPSISSQHLTRTPSSIMRQPHNFLKTESKHDLQIAQFTKDRSAQIEECRPLRRDKENLDMAQCMRKIDQIMGMLNRNSKIQQIQNNVGGELSRKMNRSKLQRTLNRQNKQNRPNEKCQKNNRQLIMQLRQKQFKISQLQQRLSRKQIQIESQRNLINLLRKINTNNQ